MTQQATSPARVKPGTHAGTAALAIVAAILAVAPAGADAAGVSPMRYRASEDGDLLDRGIVFRPLAQEGYRRADAGLRGGEDARGGEHGFDLAVADLDGDGHADLVASDPEESKVYVYFGGTHSPYAFPVEPEGNPHGVTTSNAVHFDVTLGSVPRVTITGPMNKRFGHSVAVGNLVEGGCLEIIVGAPGELSGAAGAVWRVNLGCGVMPTLNANIQCEVPGDGCTVFWGESGAGNRLGWDVGVWSSGGGTDEILAAGPGGNGTVVLVDGTTMQQLDVLHGAPGDRFGESIAACDLNGSGALDVVVGVSNPGGQGTAWVYEDSLDDTPYEIVPPARSTDDFFGSRIACGNLVPGGFDEVAVAAPYLDLPDLFNAGAVHVFKREAADAFSPVQSFIARRSGDQVGLSLDVPAVDPGEEAPLLIGVARWDHPQDEPAPGNVCGGRSNRGAVFVVEPVDGGDDVELTVDGADYPGRLLIQGEECHQLGRAVATGDWNDDGWPEIFASSGVDPSEAGFGRDLFGTVWIFSTNDNDGDGDGNVRDPDDDNDCFADGWETGGTLREQEQAGREDVELLGTTDPFVADVNFRVYDLGFPAGPLNGTSVMSDVVASFRVSRSCLDLAGGQSARLSFDISNLGNDVQYVSATPAASFGGTPDEEVYWNVTPGFIPQTGRPFTVTLRVRDPVDRPPVDPGDDETGDLLDPGLADTFRNPLEAEIEFCIAAPTLHDALGGGAACGPEARDADHGSRDDNFLELDPPTDVRTAIQVEASVEADCAASGQGCHPGDRIDFATSLTNYYPEPAVGSRPVRQDSGPVTLVQALPDLFEPRMVTPIVVDPPAACSCAFTATPAFTCGLARTRYVQCACPNLEAVAGPQADVDVHGFLRDVSLFSATASQVGAASCLDVAFEGDQRTTVVPTSTSYVNQPIVNTRFRFEPPTCSGQCSAGDTLTYNLSVWNPGNQAGGAGNAMSRLRLLLDSRLAPGSVPGCTVMPTYVDCPIDGIAANTTYPSTPGACTTSGPNRSAHCVAIQTQIKTAIVAGTEVQSMARLFVDLGDENAAEEYQLSATSAKTRVRAPVFNAAFLGGAVDENGGTLQPGDLVRFRLRVRNLGGAAADNVQVFIPHPTYADFENSDAAPGDLTQEVTGLRWRIAMLPVGVPRELVFRYRVRETAPGGGNVAFPANVTMQSDEFPTPVSVVAAANAPSILVALPELTLQKTAAAADCSALHAGNELRYTITLTKVSGGAATGIWIEDDLPDQVTYLEVSTVPAGLAWSFDDSDPDKIRWSGGFVASGTRTFNICVVPDDLPAGTMLQNLVRWSYDQVAPSVLMVPHVYTIPAAVPSLSAQVITMIQGAGQNFIQYRVNLASSPVNAGAATDVTVTLPIPMGTTYDAGTPVMVTAGTGNVMYSMGEDDVVWTIASVAPGNPNQIVFRVDAGANVPMGPPITLTGTITWMYGGTPMNAAITPVIVPLATGAAQRPGATPVGGSVADVSHP